MQDCGLKPNNIVKGSIPPEPVRIIEKNGQRVRVIQRGNVYRIVRLGTNIDKM